MSQCNIVMMMIPSDEQMYF